ncbi:MAG TPA: ArsC/Spx/MgsR family protein [Chitinophagales bacterium]|nr:ArsC/Spx/MgsR family protein [Chitinophagales bacterium]
MAVNIALEFYYLSTCDTCRRIMKDLEIAKYPFRLQDIKSEKITPEQIDFLANWAGAYSLLFSRIARKYRELNLKNQQLSELDYRNYILEDYTFLKRPVIVINENIFIGNAANNVEIIRNELHKIKK